MRKEWRYEWWSRGPDYAGRGMVWGPGVDIQSGNKDNIPDLNLIAAAPNLLEAAKLGLSVAEDWINDQLQGTSYYEEEMAKLQPIRDAIAKAEEAP